MTMRRPSLLATLLPATLGLLIGCGKPTTPAATAGTPPTTASPATNNPTTAASSNSTAPATNAVQPATAEAPATAGTPSAKPAADEPARTPATVAEAIKVLDLRKLPLVAGSEEPGRRTVAQLSYAAKGKSCVDTFEFHKKQLVEQGWKLAPNSYVTPESASGVFTRDGFAVSLSAFPGSSGKDGDTVSVLLSNHGNVNFKQLPLPTGTTETYSDSLQAMYQTNASVADTAKEVTKLLTEQGWQPYGTAGDTLNFKRNAIELSANVMSAPARDNKTVITYSAQQLSSDLPCPADAINVQYSEPPIQLGFDVAQSPDDVVKFLNEQLSKQGWEATTEKPLENDFKQMLIYRNPAKEYLEMNMHDFEGKTRVRLEFQTAEEFAELERRAKAAALAKVAKEKAKAEKPSEKFTIKLPDNASNATSSTNSIEFSVPSGKAKAAVEELRKQFVKEGWTETVAALEDVGGSLTMGKDGQTLSVIYVDPGLIPPEITISAIGIELETEK